MTDDDAQSYIYMSHDRRGENLARYGSVKKRLIAAGYRVASGAGHGAYGSSMVMSDASGAEATQALSDAPFFEELDIIDTRFNHVNHSSEDERDYEAPGGREIWHAAYDSVPRDPWDDSKNRAAGNAALAKRRASKKSR